VSETSAAAFSRAALAPPPRTLFDILVETVEQHRDAPALDDGNTVLTYAELLTAVTAKSVELDKAGVRAGDRVGVRIPSGSIDLYVSILGVQAAGAAYVPVDADDPDERARLVFAEADVALVLTGDDEPRRRRTTKAIGQGPSRPTPDDDAWIIFTSGSTGTPKGVAVSHRSAAAFVDAEARLFLRDAPIGPGDRVLAGLSVAFDASCEEMWLAWRNGACLVPAPRALVRSGMDLGPWLVAQGITIVSTVPTLASLWPTDALGAIRMLIFGGEAVPPELAERLAVNGREVWNTYGPTEATVVACAARLTGAGPVRIGLPLEGWDLAVVDKDLAPVVDGEIGELIIGGVGLARYLDPAKDSEKFAPMPSLGWDRAYRSGDLVRADPAGLLFIGRADDQVKLGGRRVELGEVDAALQALPGVVGAAAAVRTTEVGIQLLVGYVATAPDGDAFDQAAAMAQLRDVLPATMVPRLAVVDTLPTRTSGKVDRDALPWPLPPSPQEDGARAAARFDGTAGWLADQWARILAASVTSLDDDFFAHGGGSLTAAQLVSTLRTRFPEVTVADVYENSRLGALADILDEFSPPVSASSRVVPPVPRRAQLIQVALGVPLHTLVGLRWLTWLVIVSNVFAWFVTAPWAPTVSWWWAGLGWVLFISSPGRMAISVVAARLLLRGVKAGSYARGGSVHLRLWFAEEVASAAGAANLGGAPWIAYYARALGAKVGRGVDLHALPPVTGLLTLGKGCSVEPEVDLSGQWLDGDVLHLGRVRIGKGATVGSRSTLAPGARVGEGAAVAAGSAVLGAVPPGEAWAGSPATMVGMAKHGWPSRRPARASLWVAVYGITAVVLASLPLIAVGSGLALVGWWVRDAVSVGDAMRQALVMVPLATLVAFFVLALLILVAVRLLGVGVKRGWHPVRSRIGWQVWATERVMDDARTYLFPLYASLATPVWLRLLGARIGRGVEASTVVLLPKLTTVRDNAFLADDTLIGSYELGGGWLRIEPAKVGKGAFLGNSGMTAPGRKVPKRGLVAVLSATPAGAKAGTSWLGSPPVELRRPSVTGDTSRTFAPPRRLKVARAVVELFRLVPVICSFALVVSVLLSLSWVVERYGWVVAALTSGLLLMTAGLLSAVVAVLAKWALVGRFRADEQPLWSSFVWRNELADTFVEVLAAPWFISAWTGTPTLNLFLRALGARIGRGVWCETYWLPEADLVRLGAGVSVNRGCVLQTHLFHDRIMSMDTVTLDEGATLGPHGVILPAASVGTCTTVGPASLVLRGESLPPGTRWTGNPVAPWPLSATSVDSAAAAASAS